MTYFNFKYCAKVGNNSEFSQSERMTKAFPFMAQMEIKSKLFDSYEMCEDEVKKLLVTLVQCEHKITQKNYALIKKRNPLYDSESKEDAWDSSIWFRFYAAESDKLKDQILDYPFMAEITVNGNESDN